VVGKAGRGKWLPRQTAGLKSEARAEQMVSVPASVQVPNAVPV
jgi:hypothetical protein